MKKKDYKKYVEARAKKSNVLKNFCFAFLIGGIICIIGQLFMDLYITLGVEEKIASTLASITLIFIAALLTGIGVFDNIAKVAGGGTIVPITGFANSISSQAIDSKSEGFIGGVGAKIFTIAGPVILYGLLAGSVYGVILYIASLFGG